MKKLIALLSLISSLLFNACKKDFQIKSSYDNRDAYADSCFKYLRSTLSMEDFNRLDLKTYFCIQYKGQKVGVHIFEKGTKDKFLVVQNKAGNYTGTWADLTSLKAITPTIRSGSVLFRNVLNTSMTKLTIDSNKVTKLEAGDLRQGLHPGNFTANARISVSIGVDPYEVLPTVYIYGTSPSGWDGDFYSLYWMFGEDDDYLYTYYSNYNIGYETSGGGGSSTGAGTLNTGNTVVAPTFLPPANPIASLSQELKCFTIDATSTYAISVNVNQPFPDSRDLFNPVANFMVGHTFLTLQQTKANGSSVIRNVGFYPKHSVKPGTTSDQAVFGDDSNTPIDVSLKFTVTGTELNKVVNTLLDDQDVLYDLNSFNCTNVPMAALNSININLPSTKADEILFSGNNPADLGEDIRALNLTDFSAANGNRQVIRSASNANNLSPLPKEGTCQ